MKHRHCSPPEVLESRIAPATIFVGNPSQNDSEYREGPGFGEPGTQDDPAFATPFVNTATGVAGGDRTSLVLGGDPNVFYVKLTTGDKMALFNGGYTNFITGPDGTPLKGDVIAVFQDKAHGDVLPNNEVDADELVGLSLGKNVRFQVSGIVFGDVVANFNSATGSLGGSGESGGAAADLLQNPIKLFAASAVKGTIAAGGNVKGIKVTNDVGQILTGNAANAFTYDLNGSAADGGDVLSVAPAAGKRGPGISNVAVGEIGGGTLAGKLQSGGGGAGAAGGKISNITIIADTSGWTIQGGAGGDGPRGGTGAKISKVLANGLDETQSDPTANDLIQIVGGAGGSALGGGSARGGNGGSVTGVSVGFETEEGSVKRSVNAVADAVLVAGGAGGNGAIAGAGGKLKNDQVFAAPTSTDPVNAPRDLILRGGLGGTSTVGGGRAGAGGSVTNVDVRNPGNTPEGQASVARVEGGDGGGSGAGAAGGGKGGAVKNATFVAFSVAASGGDGSLGATGGKGGNLTNVTAIEGFQGVRPVNVTLDAGAGGTGSDQRGGGGGSIKNVTIRNADFQAFRINQTGAAADGGQSSTGTGGKGGSVSNLNIIDLDSNLAADTPMLISAGDGGLGGSTGGSGGAGGSLKGQNVITAFDTILTVNGGKGGNAPSAGNGGAGGKIGKVSYVATSTPGPVGEDLSGGATFQGGVGGAGVGGGRGGKGGLIDSVEVLVDGDVLTAAGNGGNGGAAGNAGAGAKVNNVALQSRAGAATVQAGNAGLLGGTKGAGGSVTDANILATTSISILAGNGSFGGNGGNIKTVGVAAPDQMSGPLTTLTIAAGNGAAAGSLAGKGGSVANVDGFIALTGLTNVAAGQGGGGSSKAGNGGSITEVNFNGGRRAGVDAAGSEVRIVAGNAGNAAGAAQGGNGGNVNGIGIGLNAFDPDGPFDPFSIDPATIIRHIAAGNGGEASGKGGAGGSVNEVRVNADIGVRSGVGFGFSLMGGIFAGSGGGGGTVGLAGSVANVSADAIASIVAGRPENGEAITARNLASVVTGISLNDSIATVVDGNGRYQNFASANLVGAVVNPDDPGVPYDPNNVMHPHANTFDPGTEFADNDASGGFSTGDTTNARTDGFIAAVRYLTASGINNFRPEALLTTDSTTGAPTFIDLNNKNGQIVIL